MSRLTSWEHKLGEILKLTSGNELVTICVIFTNILHMEMTLKFISACQKMHKAKNVHKKFRNFWKFYFDKLFVQTANANSESKSESNSSLFEIVKFSSYIGPRSKYNRRFARGRRKFILTGSYERACPNYRTISKNWVPPTQSCVGKSILKF